MSYTLEINYFNSFLLKKAIPAIGVNNPSASSTNNDSTPVWPGLPWNPTGYPKFPFGDPNSTNPFKTGKDQWYIEESRIKGGFNNNGLSLGVRAYAVNEDIAKINKTQSLIVSGLLNSRTGYNETNAFSTGENIIKDLNPLHGSIQKLYTEDTNLIVFQENKISKLLINKNTIYSGDQGAVDYINTILGQDVAYAGEYGISTNPESFAVHGFRKYFVDRFRSAVLRLSKDGITEISGYGMKDHFRDNLANITDNWQRNVVKGLLVGEYSVVTNTLSFTGLSCCDIEPGALFESSNSTPVVTGAVVIDCGPSAIEGAIDVTFDQFFTPTQATFTRGYFVTYSQSKAVGGWDAHSSQYVLSLQPKPRWGKEAGQRASTYTTTSFEESILGWPSFFSYMPSFVDSLKNKYYSFIDTNVYQHYDDTVSNNRGKYYGATTPAESSITFIFNPNPSVTKTFQTVGYEGSNGWEMESLVSDFEGMDLLNGIYSQYRDSANPVKSYSEGQYDQSGNVYPAVLTPPIYRAGFDRKENKYVANIVNSSTVRPGEVVYGSQVNGVKGYLTTCKIKIDSTTQPGGLKELFSVSSRYTISSY